MVGFVFCLRELTLKYFLSDLYHINIRCKQLKLINFSVVFYFVILFLNQKKKKKHSKGEKMAGSS